MSLEMQGQQATQSINLNLMDVLSIESGTAINDGKVDFKYTSAADYNSEKITRVPNSLKITFSKGFDIRVRANGSSFKNGNNKIPVDVLTIRQNPGSTITGSFTPIILSTQEQILFTAEKSGYALNLDFDYIIPSSRSSSFDILGKPAGSYTQTITYTATAL